MREEYTGAAYNVRMRVRGRSPGCGPFAGIVAALLLVTAGVITNFVVPGWVDRDSARIAALPLASAVALADLPAGHNVAAEGVISPAQPRLFRDFVAFVREEADMDRKASSLWRQIGRSTPPLLIDLKDGRTRVVNDNYDVRNPLGAWQDNVVIVNGSTRYRGFEVGHTVLVVGRVARDAAGTGITAEFVAAGTRADYLASQDQSVFVARVIGGVLAVLGVLVFGVAVVSLRR